MRILRISRNKLNKVIIYIAAIAVALIIMFPLYTLFMMSVISRAQLFSKPFNWIPITATFKNYIEVLKPEHPVPVFQGIMNSFIVSIWAATLSLLLASLAAYALARLRFPYKAHILTSLLSFYMLPAMLFLIPIFIIMKYLNLLDTYLSLVLPYSVWITPFATLILKSFFESIPSSVEEAAWIDGCSKLSALRRVIMPLAVPGLVATFIYAFILSWNEFLTPLIMTNRTILITTALGRYRSTYDIEIGQMSAAGIYSILPVIILTLIFQRYIIKGIVEGAIKG